MNGGVLGELLRLDNGYPGRTYIDENNYKAIYKTYQHKRNPNQK